MISNPRDLAVYVDRDDWWVGYYRGRDHHYVCLVPTLVIRWTRRHPRFSDFRRKVLRNNTEARRAYRAARRRSS